MHTTGHRAAVVLSPDAGCGRDTTTWVLAVSGLDSSLPHTRDRRIVCLLVFCFIICTRAPVKQVKGSGGAASEKIMHCECVSLFAIYENMIQLHKQCYPSIKCHVFYCVFVAAMAQHCSNFPV